MGEDRERDKQIRNGDVGRDSHRRQWREYEETRCDRNRHQVRCYPLRRFQCRKWTDVEPRRFDNSCLEVSKLMFRLLRHDDTVPREDDGAVKFQELASIFRSAFTSSSHWSIRTWQSFLQRGGGIKKRFQYCVDPSSPDILRYL